MSISICGATSEIAGASVGTGGVKLNNIVGSLTVGLDGSVTGSANIPGGGSFTFGGSGFTLKTLVAKAVPVDVKFSVDSNGDTHIRELGFLGVRGVASV